MSSGRRSSFDFIDVRRNGGLMIVCLRRPQVLNAIHPPMHAELQAAFDLYAADDAARVCIVTGEGDRAFCAGSDLKDGALRLAAGETIKYPPSGYAGLIERYDLDKPIVAVVNGLAVGGGFEIALACDLIIAADTARFGLPEPLVGQIALGGGLHRLARQIGLKQAMGLVLTGRLIGAGEALALGIVNDVVPAAELWQAADRWIEPMLRASPIALRASKQCVRMGLDQCSLEAAMTAQASFPAFADWRQSGASLEGARAFAEKRSPRWNGRA